MPIEILCNIACGLSIPFLERAIFNLGDLNSTSERPTEAQLEHFKRLFDVLKAKTIKCELFLNHVRIDEALPTVQFDDLKFNEPLVICHYHNYQQNRGLLRWPLVCTADYLDVLTTFYHFKPPKSNVSLNLTPRAPLSTKRVYGFCQFARQFPHLQKITLRNPKLAPIEKELFLTFLNELTGLTVLKIYFAAFCNDFYRLLQQLDCLRTLTSLAIREVSNEFKELLDFGFLRTFIYLKSFDTNVMTTSTMCDSVEKMRFGAVFYFFFEHKLLGDKYYRLIVSKIDHWRYQVALEKRKYSDHDFSYRLEQYEFADFSKTKRYLEVGLNLSHWLNDLFYYC